MFVKADASNRKLTKPVLESRESVCVFQVSVWNIMERKVEPVNLISVSILFIGKIYQIVYSGLRFHILLHFRL